MMTGVINTILAQARTPDSMSVSVVIALVLLASVLVASLMSSKRGHRD